MVNIPTGWECPKCGKVWAPFIPSCMSCQKPSGLVSQHPNFQPEAPIAQMGLSTRAHLTLEKMGIATVGELAKKSESDVYLIRGCGTGTLHEIKVAAERFGVRLAPK